MAVEKLGVVRPVNASSDPVRKTQWQLEMAYYDLALGVFAHWDGKSSQTYAHHEWHQKTMAKNSAFSITNELISSQGGKPFIEINVVTGEDENTNKIRRKEADRLIDFFKRHPKVKFATNPNALFNAEFELVLFKEEREAKFSGLKDKVTAFGIIEKMSHEQRQDVAYYFGSSPKEMEEDELIELLTDEHKGLVYTDTERTKKFLSIFGLKSEEGDEKECRILTHWAINNKVIENKDGKFMYGHEFIGTESDDVYKYLWQNKPVFDVIKNKKDGEVPAKKKPSK